MQTEKYARKPFLIEAVQVTAANMEDIAKWCGGTVETAERGGRTVKFIQVPVSRPANERQKKAFVRDYVLYAGKSFKCYPPKAFDDCFEKTSDSQPDQEPLFKMPTQASLEALSAKHAPGRV